MYRIGIDLGGTNIAVGVVDDGHAIVSRVSVPTMASRPAAEVVRDMGGAVEQVLARAGVSVADCRSMGVGSPGTCNSADGVVERAYNLGWDHVPVCRMLEQRFGIPCRLSNDANCAALAEQVAGAAVGHDNVVLVTLGTGVGGGIIIDSKIIAGYHGAGGEIGHACVNHNEVRPCNCGNHGCLEQYASATGIVRVANDILEESKEDSKMRHVEKLSAKNVLDFYKEGDALAVKTMEKVGDILGSTLAVFACVTDPEAIVIGGGVSKAGKPLTDCIQKYYQKYAFPSCKSTPIILASLGNDAGIYGAARMVIKD
jgi:glucokinase